MKKNIPQDVIPAKKTIRDIELPSKTRRIHDVPNNPGMDPNPALNKEDNSPKIKRLGKSEKAVHTKKIVENHH